MEDTFRIQKNIYIYLVFSKKKKSSLVYNIHTKLPTGQHRSSQNHTGNSKTIILLLLLFLSVSSKCIDELLFLYQASQKPSKYDKHNIPNVSYFLHLHETVWLNEKEHNMEWLSFITGWIMSGRKYRP